jgi:hypothetical protein
LIDFESRGDVFLPPERLDLGTRTGSLYEQ